MIFLLGYFFLHFFGYANLIVRVGTLPTYSTGLVTRLGAILLAHSFPLTFFALPT